MTGAILIRRYPAPPVDTREILRYAGVRRETSALGELLDGALSEAQTALSFSVCYCELPLSVAGDRLTVGDAVISSHALATALCGCERAVLFAATVGHPIDRLIARYGKSAPSRALMLQAIGAERVEALCDLFCRELAEAAALRGLRPTPRFSPGYGDLSLSVQEVLFRMLDCPRKIGLTLNESGLMSPSKSVTAIVGLSSQQRELEK